MTETAFWILTALAAGRRHGYAVLGEVERLSGGTVVLRVTTLYASLERLEREGRIHIAAEEVVEGRARRYYELTERGTADLTSEADRLAARAAAAQASIAAASRARVRPASAQAISAQAVTA